MRRETQNVLLILLGGALVKIALNGDYLRYVKPAQQPWIIAGGAVMVLLGAVAIAVDLLRARTVAKAAAQPGPDLVAASHRHATYRTGHAELADVRDHAPADADEVPRDHAVASDGAGQVAEAAGGQDHAPGGPGGRAHGPSGRPVRLDAGPPGRPLGVDDGSPGLPVGLDVGPPGRPVRLDAGPPGRPLGVDDGSPGRSVGSDDDPLGRPGAVAAVPDSQGSPAAGHPAHSAGDEHGHHHAARSAWLLVVPVLAVFLVAPPALGADSVTRTVARVPQSAATTAASAFPPLPAGSVVPMAMNEFVSRAGWDSNGTLNGRTVGISGFVVHTGGRTLLARLVISCCAADASPVTVRLKGGGADRFPSDTWLRVTGQVVPGTADATNSYTPDLVPATVERITAPKDPYEY